MKSKEEMIKIIEELNETQLLQVSTFLKKLTKSNQETKEGAESLHALDSLDTFMATIVHSLTNTMYDLSLAAKHKEEKVMAKRLEVYRKKVSDGWETYKKSKVQN